ncbi:hypothetical protein [Cedecea colo]|uniref:hypothetical protein n=1 Tax=Cedecea colo TaxID=2552946 RepID=UPI00142F978E|nr:hypothetical protein [Cedecea colo]
MQVRSDRFQIIIGPQVNSCYEQLSSAPGSPSAQNTAGEQKKERKSLSEQTQHFERVDASFKL